MSSEIFEAVESLSRSKGIDVNTVVEALEEAIAAAAKALPGVDMCGDAYEACRDADALVLATEWNQFRMLDLERVKELMRAPAIVDLRNVYDPEPMRARGFVYAGVGR